jgi:tetratricopeptide (TPR) repeat protein
MRRANEASRLMKKAHALESEGRYAEATEVLQFVRATVDQPDPTLPSVGVLHSTRLMAAALLATTAAKIGDRALAIDAIEEGLRLWTEVKPHMRPGKTTDNMNEWEAWARRYAATVTGE